MDTIDVLRKVNIFKKKTSSRCILFATYYCRTEITNDDVFYISKLSAFGDVYIAIDSEYMVESELQKIKKYAKVVLCSKHNEYDFGSWKYLIKHIGINKLSEYDEFVFANNSVYLVNSMDALFKEFTESSAEYYATHMCDEHYTGKLVSVDEYCDVNNFFANNAMFASFFFILKKNLFLQKFVQEFFLKIKKEENRLEVCYNYEREFSRKIIRHNVSFLLWTNSVYNNSFSYSQIAFNLARQGFPFLKKKALKNIFYQVDSIGARVLGVLKAIPAEYGTKLRESLKSTGISLPLEDSAIGLSFDEIFDEKYYAEKYEDLTKTKIDLKKHFLEHGWKEGRECSQWFKFKQNLVGYPNVSHDKFVKFLSYLENNMFLDFDAQLYYKNNPDIQEEIRFLPLKLFQHYLEFGISENRNPCAWFSTKDYCSVHPTLVKKKFNPFFHFIQLSENYDQNYLIEQRSLASRYSKSKRMVIFFNVARDTVGGGMLSINRFVKTALEIYADDVETAVVMSGVPITNKAVKHTKFTPVRPQIQFEHLVALTNPQDVTIYLPEVYAIDFVHQLLPTQTEWLYRRGSLRIVIMNQNNDFMPSSEDLQKKFLGLTTDISISAAHQTYATQALSNRYGFPVSRLTPILPECKVTNHKKKEKIIILSPDIIEHSSSKITRTEVVDHLTNKLEDFELITIEDMSLDEYLDLASRAMFSITFGEGLDGYFIEPILSGGVSFAVFNPMFFPVEFVKHPTVFCDWDVFLKSIVDDINKYSTDSSSYEQVSAAIRKDILDIYQPSVSLSDLKMSLNSEYGFSPKYNTNNSQTLENKQLSSFELVPAIFVQKLQFVKHHDGLTFLNYGGDFKQSLTDCFVDNLYDLPLTDSTEYVLFDVGSDYGLYSIYNMSRYKNISFSYMFEPFIDIARIASINVANNFLDHTRVSIQNICLDKNFGLLESMFIPSFGTLSSLVNMNKKSIFFDINSRKYFSPCFSAQIETNKASCELERLINEHKSKRFILKIDSYAHIDNILSDLVSFEILSRFEHIHLFVRFSSPSKYVNTLEKSGFHVDLKKNKTGEVFYLVARNNSL